VWVRLKYVVGIHLHGRDFLRYKLNVALHLKRLGALFIFLSRLVGEAFAQTRLRTPNWSVTRWNAPFLIIDTVDSFCVNRDFNEVGWLEAGRRQLQGVMRKAKMQICPNQNQLFDCSKFNNYEWRILQYHPARPDWRKMTECWQVLLRTSRCKKWILYLFITTIFIMPCISNDWSPNARGLAHRRTA
jgi:hypothetical protein